MKNENDTTVSVAVKSADRVLDLFELLGRWDREMSHTEIADALVIPKSSLSLLLRNLVNRGYLELVSHTKKYRLGGAFAALAQQSAREFDLVACAEPIVKQLTATLGESSAFNRLKGQMAEIIATAVGPHRLVSHMHVGDTAPLYATSSGKVILAHLSDEMQKEYLMRLKINPFTSGTVKTVDALKRQLSKARKSGVAFSFEEFTPGIVGVAAVVQGRPGRPIGALHIAMPAVRSSAEVLERAEWVLLRTAKEMSAQMLRADDDNDAATATGQPHPVKPDRTRR